MDLVSEEGAQEMWFLDKKTYLLVSQVGIAFHIENALHHSRFAMTYDVGMTKIMAMVAAILLNVVEVIMFSSTLHRP